MKKCKHCGSEYEPKNPKGKYCSDKCRVYGNRSKAKIDYNPPPIFTSAANIKKIDAAFKNEINPLIAQRIAELEKELKNPPTNPQIGLKMWKRIRETEISNLKNTQPPSI